ncbi:glycosyltransferase family 4 protein [Bacillus cereus]|uniref:glycosyltransferase family 4 protein n=1 Tax=Bacillus cereus TaxID=1396 RepID=UPI00356EF07E
MKERVLLVGPNRNIVGGVATHINILKKALEQVELDTSIYELKDYSNNSAIFKKMNDIIKIIKIRKEANSEYLAIHLNPSIYYGSFFKLILTLASLKHNNIIVQFHGGSFENLNKINSKLLLKFISNILKKAKTFIFLSTEQRDSFLEKFPMFQENTTVLPNFIDINDESISLIKNEKLTVLFLARLIEEKGVFDLIEAVKDFKENEILVNIIGDGPCKEQILKEITENNLNEKVKFLGAKFGLEKELYMKISDVYVLPSSWREGVPYTVLESMKYKTAVLCTPQGGLKDIIVDGYNGIFIKKDANNIAESLKKMKNNKSLVKEISENAYQYLKGNLSTEKAGVVFKTIYTGNKE